MPKTATDLGTLIASYRLCAQAEGKKPRTIEMVASCVGYLEDFLNSEGFPTDVSAIGPTEIRAYMLYLQHKKSFSDHRYTHMQPHGLSEHTINSYLRSIRAFWGWLVAEEIVMTSPFSRARIPKAPRKIVPTFTETQIRALLSVIDTSTIEGYRDSDVIINLPKFKTHSLTVFTARFSTLLPHGRRRKQE